jgi:L-seryl-tRNA(Ser) seleniumtransferase
LREEKLEVLLRHLTGCEAATVVNNNAAASMLVLQELCAGREVIVSRGQLIEIGGAFRIPEVLRQSGATMVEVGTTNRTHLRDYAAAITPATGALLHVHTSNYRIRGFAGTPGIGELCALGRERSLPVIDDLGSGALVPLTEFGLDPEPLVSESLAAGATAVCFSGDKLICGPQAGLICGTAAVIDRIRRNPFARMFRVCKLTLAALETTLTHFVDGSYRERLPFYRLLATPPAVLARRARALRRRLPAALAATVRIEAGESFVGSGSIPDTGIPTRVLVVPAPPRQAAHLATALRTGTPAIFCRIHDDALCFDLRTVAPADLAVLATRLTEVCTA